MDGVTGMSLYLKIPEILRKYIRDFVVLFLTLLAASSVLWQDTPSWNALLKVSISCLGLAAWRFGRDLLTPYLYR